MSQKPEVIADSEGNQYVQAPPAAPYNSNWSTEAPRLTPTPNFCNPNNADAITNPLSINQYQSLIKTGDFSEILAKQVQSWSDYRDYENVRYTFTYMSPELIQVALLRLAQERHLSQTELETLSDKVIGQLSGDGELVFLFTITSPQSNSIRSIDIPEFSIINTYGKEAYPIRWDRVFDSQMDMNRGVQFGFIMFPAGVYQEDNCTHTINFERDTSILVKTTDYPLNKLTWSINTSPIGRMVAESIPTKEPSQQTQENNTSQVIIYQAVPTPQIDTVPDFPYWLDFAGFIVQILGLFL